MRKEKSPRERELQRYAAKYLEPSGWFRSYELGRCVDVHGRAIPWYTYPAIRALEPLVKPNHKVFEYGSGSSSLWWRARAACVASVEHDPAWFESGGDAPEPHSCVLIDAHAETNSRHRQCLQRFYAAGLEPTPTDDPSRNWRAGLLSRPFESYAAELLNYPQVYFDIIVVDGMSRVMCAWLAAERLKSDGFIVFDNSDRDIYSNGYDALRQAGFLRIDFWGTGPLNPYEWCTSIFTRSLDVFG